MRWDNLSGFWDERLKVKLEKGKCKALPVVDELERSELVHRHNLCGLSGA